MRNPSKTATSSDDVEPPVPTVSPIAADPIAPGSRVSDRTNIHDEGSGANDTADGLSETEEAIRQAAEDVPLGRSLTGPIEEIPVFDRGGLPPKV